MSSWKFLHTAGVQLDVVKLPGTNPGWIGGVDVLPRLQCQFEISNNKAYVRIVMILFLSMFYK